jgi:sterol desaturase/sphingolipid hydroxylase (fatty acid hydroxylase superfamily)
MLPPAIAPYLHELAQLPQYLAVIFPFFAALAYGYACLRTRTLLRSWSEIREAIVPAQVYRCSTVRFDMSIFPMQLLLVTPAAGYVGSLYTAERFATILAGPHPAPTAAPGLAHALIATAVQVFAAEILGTFGAFIFHYAGHKTPLFWSLHKVHHSAEALSPFTVARGHPLDTLLGESVSFVWRTLVVGEALYLTGGRFTPAALAIISILAIASLVQGALNHSHVPLSYGWFNRIWVGPTFHHLHHSAELKHRDRNFGGGIPVWDWLFGTMYLPDPNETYDLGLNEHEIGERNPHNSFKGYLLDPMVEFARELAKLLGGALAPAPKSRSAVRPPA